MNIKIIKSKRKTISLSVDDELNAVVRAPFGVSDKEAYAFVAKNEKWLGNAVLRKKEQLEKYNISPEEKQKLIDKANDHIPKRVEYYSRLMNLKPTGVKITSAKKRFGSCNGKNSVCFSYYLMLYPEDAIDYVVVHELAHIKHHNHSKDFYALVKRFMPDYKSRENILKKHG